MYRIDVTLIKFIIESKITLHVLRYQVEIDGLAGLVPKVATTCRVG